MSGRLWRKTRPDLSEDKRQSLVAELMAARRGIATARRSGDLAQERAYRHAVHEAKVALGERGPVWWGDGAPDFNRYMAVNTPYAEWFSQFGESGD
ncbi:hypothetical protein GCM10022626_20750 [[Pseudomonas] carboxydohydrogena]